MNILFIAYSFNPCEGGVQRVTDILAKEFLRRGHQVSYLSGCCKYNNVSFESSVPIFYMNEDLYSSFTKKSKLFYLSLLKDLKIDVIINQYPLLKKSDFFLKHTPSNILKLSFYHGSPIGSIKRREGECLALHGLEKVLFKISIIKQKYLLKKRFKQIVTLSDKLCFLSNSYKAQVIDLCKDIEVDKLYTIANPNTFPTFQPVFSRDKGNVILFIGRISDPVKNIKDFIKAWEIISRKYPDWKALLVGDDSGCDDYKEYIKTHNISNISFEGISKNISDYYKSAKIICVTSLHEGWPMVIVEAQQFGCVPISYSTFNSVYDLIKHNYNGIICKPFDINDLVKNLDNLMANQNEMVRLSGNAYKYIQQYDVHNICDIWELLFKSRNKSNIM